jgi:hypothetical protein
MSSSRPVFRSRWLPYLLVAPQLVITVIFFIWPAGEALWYSVQSVDPFGLSSQFVGLDNFVALFHDSYYLESFWTTMRFSALVTFLVCSPPCSLPRWSTTWCAAAVLSDPDAAALCRGASGGGGIMDFPQPRPWTDNPISSARWVRLEPCRKQRPGDVPGGLCLGVEADKL